VRGGWHGCSRTDLDGYVRGMRSAIEWWFRECRELCAHLLRCCDVERLLSGRSFVCRDQSARLRRASVLLPEAGSISLACPRESNHRDGGNAKRNGTPDDAPSVRWTEGTRSGCGVFRQDIRVLSKNWPSPCGHPAGFPPPARRCHTGTRRAKSKARSSNASASTRPPLPNPLPQGEREKCDASRMTLKNEAKATADAKQGSALSPLRIDALRCSRIAD